METEMTNEEIKNEAVETIAAPKTNNCLSNLVIDMGDDALNNLLNEKIAKALATK